MRTLQEIIPKFKSIASSPRGQLEKYLSKGKKAVGCLPYYCPEELVHAADMVPFGLWGADTQVSQAGRFLPAFICSIIQTVLEVGIRGGYAGLSAVMAPMLCDSLKSMDGNWRYGVADIPIIPVAHAQNRKIDAGVEFTASRYRKIMSKLSEISGKSVTDDDILESIEVYRTRNASVRRLIDELSIRPNAIKPSERNAVFKSGYFMEAGEYTAMIDELADCIATAPQTGDCGPRIVTCGIIADNAWLLNALDDFGVCIVDDVIVYESLRYRYDAPESPDPMKSLAMQIGSIEGCPILYDPGKKRADMLADIVRQRTADATLLILTKFCDPEEYDMVPLKRKLDSIGVRCFNVEIDRQATNAGQIRTAVETFCEILKRGG